MLKDVPTKFSGAKAYEYCKYLAITIGPRLTGTAGEHKAANYIAKMFRSFGLKTRLQRFPVTTFEASKCTFEARDGKTWRSYAVEPVGLSKSTPLRGVESEFALLDNADSEYFSGRLRDKIVLLLGTMNMADLPKLCSFGPKALIFMDSGIADEPIRRVFRDYQRTKKGNLPMAHIKHMDAVDIAKRGLTRGRLNLQLTEKKSYGLNVIGEKVGSDRTDEIAVVCGHYDTSMGIQGASDNAGGTAIMMELARVLTAEPTRRTLRFVAFACEETGLNGSLYYADDLAKRDKREKNKATFDPKLHTTELDRHRLVFNVDVHGAILGNSGFQYSGVDDVGAAVRLLTKELGVHAGVSKGPMSSDGSALAAVGVPAVQYARTGGTTRFLHSTRDQMKFISAEALAQAGGFSEVFLRRYVIDAAALAFPRQIPKDQEEALKAYHWPELKKTKKKKAKKRSTARPARRS